MLPRPAPLVLIMKSAIATFSKPMSDRTRWGIPKPRFPSKNALSKLLGLLLLSFGSRVFSEEQAAYQHQVMLLLRNKFNTRLFVCAALAIITLVSGLECPRCANSDCDQVTGSCNAGCIKGFSGDDCDVAELACLPGWMEYDGNCFIIPPRLGDFEEAIQICSVDFGGWFTKIKNLEFNDWHNKKIQEIMRPNSWGSYWTSLNDIDKEGVYVWAGETEPAKFTNFRGQIPYPDSWMAVRDCVSGNWRDKGKWAHKECGAWYNFMCERLKDCPFGFYGPNCLQHCKSCLERCERDTGKCVGGCIVGYRGDYCQMTCEDGTYGAGCATMCKTPCICDHINGSCLSGTCMKGWSGDNCEISNHKCRPGWELFDRSCFLFIRDKKLSFAKARSHCEALDSHVTTVRTPSINAFIIKAMSLNHKKHTVFFIGMNDLKKEGKFEWLDGEEVDFTNWAKGEPNNYGAGEDCTSIRTATSKWNDFVCGYKLPFVCEHHADCIPGFWGEKCHVECGKCWGGGCDSLNGECVEGCEVGWKGMRCEEQCSFPNYGKNCSSTCDNCESACDPIHGECQGDCKEGYEGRFCHELIMPIEEEPEYVYREFSVAFKSSFMSGSSCVEWRQFIVYSFLSPLILRLHF
ncbi:hypothetical protein ScPMuIL_010205 [Solemya velum]